MRFETIVQFKGWGSLEDSRFRADALSKGDHDVQFAKVHGRLDLLTWMVGVSIALNIAVLIKLFAI